MESMNFEWSPGQPVAPVVKVTDNQRRQFLALSVKIMLKDVPCLPIAFPFGQSQVPVRQVEWSGWRFDDRHLRPARLVLMASQ